MAALNISPSRADTTTLTISAVGDWGCTSNTASTVSNIQAQAPNTVLGLGDYSYASTLDCWAAEIGTLDSIMHPAIGNHDTGLTSELESRYGLANSYYSFNSGNVHFLALDPNIAYVIGSSQYSFADTDLAQADTNSSISWKIVYFHQPMYSSPTTHAPLAGLRDAYHPLFDRYHVNVVLQAHNHNYQRTYPLLYNPLSPPNPAITVSSLSSYVCPSGEIYLTVGTAGQ